MGSLTWIEEELPRVGVGQQTMVAAPGVKVISPAVLQVARKSAPDQTAATQTKHSSQAAPSSPFSVPHLRHGSQDEPQAVVPVPVIIQEEEQAQQQLRRAKRDVTLADKILIAGLLISLFNISWSVYTWTQGRKEKQT